jgi:hypothetical protein
MAYTTIDDPSAFFQTMLHAEDDTAFTFDGNSDLQPDWIWNKNRDENNYHPHMIDSVRGISKLLRVSTSAVEFTSADSITAIGSNGFTTGADDNGYVSSGTDKQVSWCWKTGTSFSNDASATSVGSIDSAGSVNTTAGFSIITYTGTGSVGTIAHGLGVVPSMYILKRRAGSTENWPVYHKSVGNTHALYLNTTDAQYDYANFTNDTSPTSAVFTVGGSNDQANPDGSTMVAYCFAEKQGYSKFGSYEGTNNANGTFVYTGFSVGWVMIKNIDAGSTAWVIQDSKRSSSGGGNQADKRLRANASNAEETDSPVDLLSNGFKIRSTGSFTSDANTFIYWAFAESPFVTSTGVPATAR